MLSALALASFAQETQETIVDEVIAQVNEDVITLSQVKREKKALIDEFVRQGKTREEAEKEVVEKEGQLIANLIREEMIRQKGVEIGVDKSVETEINQRLLKLMNENKLKSLNDLYAAMRSQGVDPELLKETWRSQLMQQQVYFQLVDLVVYWETSDQELKDYFKANEAKFNQKEMVKLSEIFLAFAGKNEAEVEKLASDIVKRARDGEDFSKLVAEYSDRPDKATSNGFVGEFEYEALNENIKTGVKGLRTGDIADPIKLDIGMEIIRVDQYTPASTESNFDENVVRRAIMLERAPKRRVKFLTKLQEDSYIKIRETYRGAVMPFLTAPSDETTASSES